MIMRQVTLPKNILVFLFIPGWIVQAVRCVKMFFPENGNPVVHTTI
jgi:uncharacterized membrane protein